VTRDYVAAFTLIFIFIFNDCPRSDIPNARYAKLSTVASLVTQVSSLELGLAEGGKRVIGYAENATRVFDRPVRITPDSNRHPVSKTQNA
jgi:hypothetical protein